MLAPDLREYQAGKVGAVGGWGYDSLSHTSAKQEVGLSYKPPTCLQWPDSSARLHLPKVLHPSKTVPLAGDEVFKLLSSWAICEDGLLEAKSLFSSLRALLWVFHRILQLVWVWVVFWWGNCTAECSRSLTTSGCLAQVSPRLHVLFLSSWSGLGCHIDKQFYV